MLTAPGLVCVVVEVGGLEMVEDGFGWWYQRYSKDEALKKAEMRAGAAKRGLWVGPKPIPPFARL